LAGDGRAGSSPAAGTRKFGDSHVAVALATVGATPHQRIDGSSFSSPFCRSGLNRHPSCRVCACDHAGDVLQAFVNFRCEKAMPVSMRPVNIVAPLPPATLVLLAFAEAIPAC
jgi:hypothetical protein